MASVHEVIDAFRSSRSTSEQGTQFEQLMVRWFELDPTLSEQYDRVWRWPEWPGRHNHGDNGIDLVAHIAETGPDFGVPDEYAAVQCKFYDPEHRLAKAVKSWEVVYFPSAETMRVTPGQGPSRA